MFEIEVITPPEVEPVDLATAKLYARVDNDAEDDLITLFITSARMACESYCNRYFITQTIGITYDACDIAYVKKLIIPAQKLQSLDTVTAYTEDGDEVEVSNELFYVAGSRLVFKDDFSLPTDIRTDASIRFNVIVGYGDDPENVPMPIREAILRLVAHIYQNREAYYDSVNGSWNGKNAPDSVTKLLMPYRVFKI